MKNTKLKITIAILGTLHGSSFGLGTDSEVPENYGKGRRRREF